MRLHLISAYISYSYPTLPYPSPSYPTLPFPTLASLPSPSLPLPSLPFVMLRLLIISNSGFFFFVTSDIWTVYLLYTLRLQFYFTLLYFTICILDRPASSRAARPARERAGLIFIKPRKTIYVAIP